jgi:hypothetical protein
VTRECSFKRCSGEERFEFKYSAQVDRGRRPDVCGQQHTMFHQSSRFQMLCITRLGAIGSVPTRKRTEVHRSSER